MIELDDILYSYLTPARKHTTIYYKQKKLKEELIVWAEDQTFKNLPTGVNVGDLTVLIYDPHKEDYCCFIIDSTIVDKTEFVEMLFKEAMRSLELKK